jgi:hypothetical protein
MSFFYQSNQPRYLFDRNKYHKFKEEMSHETESVTIIYRGQRLTLSKDEFRDKSVEQIKKLVNFWASKIVDRNKRIMTYGN